MLGRGLEHVEKRGDEGVNAATHVLQIDKQHIEALQHRIGGTTHGAVETKDRNSMDRIEEIRGLDHVVLHVAANSMLWTESGCQLDIAGRSERIERVCECVREGSRMREQRGAPALERSAQLGLGN